MHDRGDMTAKTLHLVDNREAAYMLAFGAINYLDPSANLNTTWRINGQLCQTLDEAVRALEAGGKVTASEPLKAAA